MTHDLWTLATKTAAGLCVCIHTFEAVCCLCLDDTELIHSGGKNAHHSRIFECVDRIRPVTLRPGLSERWTTKGGQAGASSATNIITFKMAD